MVFKKVGGRRNFGYGRSLEYATSCALLDGYTEGRFGTRRAYASRFNNFIAFLRNNHVYDFCNVSSYHVKEYAESLYGRVLLAEFSLNYAVACLSAVNCVMTIMRDDNLLWISPRQYLGPRLFLRQDAPETLDLRVVEAAALHLEENGEDRLAGVLRLCAYFGLRYREASLLDVKSALRSAKRSGEVTVFKGTKGGRKRVIQVGLVGIEILRSLNCVIAPATNLIPTKWSFKRWQGYCYRTWREYALQIGIDNRFKELRTAFACRLYEDVTGAPAPVLAGGRVVDRELDRVARTLIADCLGHGREQVAAAYVGTTRRAPS